MFRLSAILAILLRAVIHHVAVCVVDARVLQGLIHDAEHLLNTHHDLATDRVYLCLVRRHLMLNISVHSLNANRIVDAIRSPFDGNTMRP